MAQIMFRVGKRNGCQSFCMDCEGGRFACDVFRLFSTEHCVDEKHIMYGDEDCGEDFSYEGLMKLIFRNGANNDLKHTRSYSVNYKNEKGYKCRAYIKAYLIKG